MVMVRVKVRVRAACGMSLPLWYLDAYIAAGIVVASAY